MARPANKMATRQRVLPLEASVRVPAPPSRANLALARGVREIGLLLLACFILFVFVALLTYNSADPGWSSTASLGDFQSGTIHNLGGYFGAWLADVLFSVFGRLAYLLPIVLTVYSVLRIQKRHRLEPLDPTMLALRLIGLLLVMVAGTSIATLQWPTQITSELPFSSGGLVGQSLAKPAEETLGLLGSTSLLSILFLFGFTIFTDLSWLWLMDEVGRITLSLIGHSRQSVLDVQRERSEKRSADDAREERQRTMDAHRLRMEKRKTPAPVIVEPPVLVEKVQPSKRVAREKQVRLFSDDATAGELPALL